MSIKFVRWADRDGKTVRWGNLIGCYRGQEFEETFSTEAEAVERERQANACEAISDKREPTPIKRAILH